MITAEDFKNGKDASIIELMVLGRQLGIDVDSVREKHLESQYRELSDKIRETLEMEIELVKVMPPKPGDEKQIDGVWRVWVKCPDCGLERWITKTNTQRGTFTGLCKPCSLKVAIRRGDLW